MIISPAGFVCAGWELSYLLFVPSLSVFAHYYGLVWGGFEADKVPPWRIQIKEFLVFECVSFVAATGDGVFMSKTTDGSIVPHGLGLLAPAPHRLTG